MWDQNAWRAMLDRIVSRGKLVFDTASVDRTDKGTKDPKVWALALLARTVSNVEGALVVLNAGHPIEARTLVRCAYENFFCAAALVKTGGDFIRVMELDDAMSRKTQAKQLQGWAGKQKQQPDFTEELSKFTAALAEKHPKPLYLDFQKAAKAGMIDDPYIFYKVLSNDAAHPTVTSLSHYITWDGDDTEWALSAKPELDPDEIEETLEFACGVMLGVTVAVNEAVGGGTDGESLFKLSDDLRALSNASKAKGCQGRVSTRPDRQSD